MTVRKNIILLTIDDGGAFWRFRDVFGERLRTPNLDRIFAASAAFTSAYCQAPICGPSRNSLMTGLSPHQTGLLDNYTDLFSVMRPEQLWQFRLKRAGYYCSTAGKVHHSFAPLPNAIHETLYSHPPTRLTLGPSRDAATTRFGGLTGGAATTDLSDDTGYYDHQSADDAISFIRNYSGEAPFYREVGFHHPHIPFKTPLRFKELYDEDAFSQPEDWKNGFDTADYPDLYMIENLDVRDRAYWRKSVRNYFSAYSHVDSHIGRVWDALQSSAHAKDTVFIVTSDHGFHLGDKNRMRKFTLWEECCRVPLLIHVPEAPAQEIDAPVALLDIGPTILDFAELPPIRGAPGRSLKQIVAGNEQADPDRGVPTFLYGNCSMRKGPYRITLYQNGESEFHDVEVDPWLTKNVAKSHPEYESVRRDLSVVCAEHGLDLHDDLASGRLGEVRTSRRSKIEELDRSRSNRTPLSSGRGVHFATLDRDGTAYLPEGYETMHYAADTGGQVRTFAAHGNSADNTFCFPGSFNRFDLSIHTGPGRNTIIAQNDDLIVYGDEGENRIRSGNSNCVIFGGTGPSEIHIGAGKGLVHGGAGDAQLFGGTGPSEMICGAGQNRVETGTGFTRVTVDGGQNTIILGSADVHLTILRTGLAQRVEGYRGGTVDISDWAAMGPAQLVQIGGDAVLSCHSERVVFNQTSADDLRLALAGSIGS